MGKFRKKPVVIEAIRVRDVIHAAATSWTDLPAWIREAYNCGVILFGSTSVTIRTLEGTHEGRGRFNDWIIRGIKGELYLCKPEIFDMTYEPEPLSDTPQSTMPDVPAHRESK